ncbi:hypothetical protein EV426DRAFT_588202 [Tirmania nivea]|nr:hypothetical protein EV426DRAFT_588202 [Tirmania nivea]
MTMIIFNHSSPPYSILCLEIAVYLKSVESPTEAQGTLTISSDIDDPSPSQTQSVQVSFSCFCTLSKHGKGTVPNCWFLLVLRTGGPSTPPGSLVPRNALGWEALMNFRVQLSQLPLAPVPRMGVFDAKLSEQFRGTVTGSLEMSCVLVFAGLFESAVRSVNTRKVGWLGFLAGLLRLVHRHRMKEHARARPGGFRRREDHSLNGRINSFPGISLVSLH